MRNQRNDPMNSASDYQIISTLATNILEQKVREEIGKGWIPLGGLAIAMVPKGKKADAIFSQAMIRE
jgi:hypothetical protein